MRYDDKVDGEVQAKPGSEVRWKLSVRNDRISGSLADKKETDPTNHRLAGEIVAGNPPILTLRQDGPKAAWSVITPGNESGGADCRHLVRQSRRERRF